MAFTPQQLLAALVDVDGDLWVAFSGGMDSTVLLHALARLRGRLRGTLRAVHVDHGLQADARAWTAHCTAVCDGLEVPMRVLSVDARSAAGESREAAAREVRYGALSALLGADDVLLTAQHQDDQAETLLLQLLRGSGPRGLSAMPDWLPLGRGRLLRPLLGFTRVELAAWADSEGLRWVEDPSNRDQSLDRNFLRHSVLPLLSSRWPTVERTLARAAGHQQDASELLDVLAAADLQAALGADGSTLRATALQALSAARGRNLLRYWLRRQRLRPPAAVVLERVLKELLPARPERNPVVHWHGAEIRRYRGQLYALALPRPPLPTLPCDWDLQVPLPFAGGVLLATTQRGQGLRRDALVHGVRVELRRGGERCRPLGQPHRRRLKQLLQQSGLPPWCRERLALLYVGDALVQVVGVCIDAGWAAGADQSGVLVSFVEAGRELGPNETAG